MCVAVSFLSANSFFRCPLPFSASPLPWPGVLVPPPLPEVGQGGGPDVQKTAGKGCRQQVCVCPSSQAVSVLLPPLDQTSITVSRSWGRGAFGPSPTGCLKSKGQQVKSPSLDCELIYKCESFNQAELKDPPPHTQRFKEILVLSSASPCLPCGRTILRGGPSRLGLPPSWWGVDGSLPTACLGQNECPYCCQASYTKLVVQAWEGRVQPSGFTSVPFAKASRGEGVAGFCLSCPWGDTTLLGSCPLSNGSPNSGLLLAQDLIAL